MTDYINRADAIEAIQNAYCKPCKERGDDHNEVRCRVCDYDNAIIQIDALPSADAVHGEWIKRGTKITCSHCKSAWSASFDTIIVGMKYCPNCGARMKGGDDE